MPNLYTLQTQVNSKALRRENYNGREHIVIPSYTLPANVIMNGGLYPASEIEANYQKLEGTLAPVGHPTVDGEFVSAFSPEGINQGHVGAWNRNVSKVGNRVYIEKWLDIEVAERSELGRELIERVTALEQGLDVPAIHTSVAVFIEKLKPNEAQRKNGAEWVAKIKEIDHDAILLNEVGAATPEQGVGLMVNVDTAVPLNGNAGIFGETSYRERERLLDIAAREKWGDDGGYAVDFDDNAAVFIRHGASNPELFQYEITGGKAIIADTGTPVKEQRSWVHVIANKLKSILPTFRGNPDNHKQEQDMPITPEERAAIVADIGSAVAEQLNNAIKPLSEAVAELQANQTNMLETVTASARAAEASKREVVAKKFGEVVANALTGDALDEAYNRCIPENNNLRGNDAPGNASDSIKPEDFNAYMGA